jgi:hypothetical protein
MRLIAVTSGLAMLLAGGDALAQADTDCVPPDRRGGFVNRLDRSVTSRIGQDGCGQANQSDSGDRPNQPAADPDCTNLTLVYRPAAILYRHLANAELTYSPPRCKRPDGSAAFTLAAGSRDIFRLHEWGSVEVNENTAASATVQARHGSLSATAEVASKARPHGCTGMALSYDPPSIHVDDERKGSLSFLPQDCLDVPGHISQAKFSSSAPLIARTVPYNEDGAIRGLRPGQATITASLAGMTASANVTVVNDGPPCESLELRYSPRRVPLGGTSDMHDRFSPYLSYRPHNCAQPEGSPQFHSVTPAVATADAATGAVTGLAIGTGRIGVAHKSLNAVAEVEIIPMPACDQITVSYEPRRFPLRTESTATLSYWQSRDSQAQFEPCRKPDGAPQFNADPAAGVQFLPDGSGNIRGLAVGSPQVTVKHGALSNTAYVDVIDAAACKSVVAKFNPPSIAVGQQSNLQLTHQPEGCAPSAPREFKAPANASFTSSELALTADGHATGRRAGDYTVFVYEGEENSKDRIYATASISVTGGCTGYSVQPNPATIEVGAESLLVFRFDPADCRPVDPPHESWIRLRSDAVEKKFAGGSLSLVGKHGGDVSFLVQPGVLGIGPDGNKTVGRSQRLTVRVTAPPCTGLEIKYSNPQFRPHRPLGDIIEGAGGGWPALVYSPDGCTRPAGKLAYSSADRNFVVDPATGWISVHPARGTAEVSYITVNHGELTAFTKVGNF